jgi:hypothetical protein
MSITKGDKTLLVLVDIRLKRVIPNIKHMFKWRLIRKNTVVFVFGHRTHFD